MRQWQKRVWVGFCDGRPDYRFIDTGWGGFGSPEAGYRTIIIFTDRARARKEYQDVRPMMLTLPNGEYTGGRTIGGRARAAALTPKRRAEIASTAAKARWARK